jgi:uncharacterized membrane protein
MFSAQWLIGKLGLFPERGRAWFLTGLAISTMVLLAIGTLLIARRSPRVRAIAAGGIGSSFIVLIGGAAFAIWIFR